MIRLALLLGGMLLVVTPAHATTFRVDATTDSSTIVGCRTPGRCCNTCHVEQAAAKSKTPPKHDRALYGKYLQTVAEGQKLTVRGESYVTKEKGQLVLYEGKTRKVLPASTLIVKDEGGRYAVILDK
jgi:hypothetical protein